MELTNILTKEHRLIRRYLDDIVVVIDLMKAEKWPGKEFFETGIEFTRSFSDRFHHYREEYIMFLKLAEKKHGEMDAQIMFLRDQHERARNFTSEISRSLDKYTMGDSIHTANVIENLGYYNLLLRQHINREDHVFFPMASEMFTESEEQELLAEFKKAENKFEANFYEISKTRVDEMSGLLKTQFGEDYVRRAESLPRAHEE